MEAPQSQQIGVTACLEAGVSNPSQCHRRQAMAEIAVLAETDVGISRSNG